MLVMEFLLKIVCSSNFFFLYGCLLNFTVNTEHIVLCCEKSFYILVKFFFFAKCTSVFCSWLLILSILSALFKVQEVI